MHEHILLFRKGKRTPMQNGENITNTFNWFINAVPQSNYKEGRIHPAQWPINLPLRIIARTPGEPILDPFAGSGSTGVAAKILSRNFIGFDLIENVTGKANKRIELAQEPINGLNELMQMELEHASI